MDRAIVGGREIKWDTVEWDTSTSLHVSEGLDRLNEKRKKGLVYVHQVVERTDTPIVRLMCCDTDITPREAQKVYDDFLKGIR